MRTLAVLPIKSFDAAKTRLGDLLGSGSRRALAQAMSTDVLTALRRVPGIEAIAVVTRDPQVHTASIGDRVTVLSDHGEEGQSSAAQIGIRHALAGGFERVLLVPGDTPLLDPSEIDALLDRGQTGGVAVAIVPDRHEEGTNALLLSPPAVLEPSFGPGSLARHRAAAEAAGIRYSVERVPSLLIDVDTPDDFAELGAQLERRRGSAPLTRGAIRQLQTSRAPQPRSGEQVPGRARHLTISDLTLTTLSGIPEVTIGDDLAGLLYEAASNLADGDILAIAHKVVSKSEGRVRRLSEVEPGERARELAAEHDKDPRVIQVILDESASVLRAERGILVCETHSGLVCANAGVDGSNMPDDDTVVLLPEDPDASARALRAAIAEHSGARPAVLISDTFGRPWRLGQTDVAIGAAGLRALDDWRGRNDHSGRELAVTQQAAGDALAAAADLARAKDSREPAVVIRGLERLVTPEDGPGAAALRRPREEDLFR